MNTESFICYLVTHIYLNLFKSKMKQLSYKPPLSHLKPTKRAVHTSFEGLGRRSTTFLVDYTLYDTQEPQYRDTGLRQPS